MSDDRKAPIPLRADVAGPVAAVLETLLKIIPLDTGKQQVVLATAAALLPLRIEGEPLLEGEVAFTTDAQRRATLEEDLVLGRLARQKADRADLPGGRCRGCAQWSE